jgi:hypothetical protein
MIAPNLLGVKPLDMGPRARCSPFPVPFVGDTKASDLGSGPRQPVGLFRLATG